METAMPMKAPKYAAMTVQEMIDAGINGFAMQLMAESHADNPDKFRDETVLLSARAHNNTPVYMLISTQVPNKDQFVGWPGGPQAWGPIETAPKDKTRVIVSVPSFRPTDPAIIGVAYFDPETHDGAWWWDGTQLDQYHNACIEEGNDGPPTHWMPLPSPPVKAASAQ